VKHDATSPAYISRTNECFTGMSWPLISLTGKEKNLHRRESNKQIRETNICCVPFDVGHPTPVVPYGTDPGSVTIPQYRVDKTKQHTRVLFYHWERYEKVDHVRHRGLKECECVANRFSPCPYCEGLFGHCRPLAASQVTRRKDMEVLHKICTTLDHTHAHLLMSVDHPKT